MKRVARSGGRMNQRCELQFDNYTERAEEEAVSNGCFWKQRGGKIFPAASTNGFCLTSIRIERASEFRTHPRIRVRVWSTVKGGVSSLGCPNRRAQRFCLGHEAAMESYVLTFHARSNLGRNEYTFEPNKQASPYCRGDFKEISPFAA